LNNEAIAKKRQAAAVPKIANMNNGLMAAILIDCMAAIPWAGWSLARAGITKVENAKKTPATSPQPSAAKSFNVES
jgi:hypothetical protein